MRSSPVVERVCCYESQRLVVCDVGTRDAYRNPESAAKKAPWELTCIPTLIALEGGWQGRPAWTRLASELEQCKNDEQCIDLVRHCVQ